MALEAGRPSIFTEDIETQILERLSAGESLLKICETEGFPHRGTVIRWMAASEEFATKCARAREAQADVMDDRVLDTAEAVIAGKVDPHAGKVAISAYQWRASKLKPKVYGDATMLKHADANGESLKIEVTHVLDAKAVESPKRVIEIEAKKDEE